MGTAVAIAQQSWMDMWMKFVAEQQEAILKAEALQLPYKAVQEALETVQHLKIDTFKLDLSSTSVTLHFTANDHIDREEYWVVYRAIHDALVARKCISPGSGTFPSWKDKDLRFSAHWAVKKPKPKSKYDVFYVFLVMRIPVEGTHNFKVTKSYEQVSYTNDSYLVAFKDEHDKPPFAIGPKTEEIF